MARFGKARKPKPGNLIHTPRTLCRMYGGPLHGTVCRLVTPTTGTLVFTLRDQTGRYVMGQPGDAECELPVVNWKAVARRLDGARDLVWEPQ